MIRPLTAPITERWAGAPSRTPGRYEGLVNFSHRLSGRFGSALRHWTVLDVGGGDGWLGEILICARYFLTDPAAPLAPLFRRHRPVRGCAEALPYHAGAVDLVVSKQTLPHFTDPAAACREMRRVAREAVVIQQEFPEGPIGWPGHSRSQIDTPGDILEALAAPGWTASYDGTDFLARRDP